MAFILTLWIGNGAVLKSSSQWQLTLSQTSPGLTKKSFENTLGKGEIARNKQFLLFPLCFYPSVELSAIFIKFAIVFCKPVQF